MNTLEIVNMKKQMKESIICYQYWKKMKNNAEIHAQKMECYGKEQLYLGVAFSLFRIAYEKENDMALFLRYIAVRFPKEGKKKTESNRWASLAS